MTNIIKIKRSSTAVNPVAGSLAQGEMAYSESTGTGDGEMWIGIAGATEEKIGGFKDVTKLAGIEALADVTDATNVNAAGAVMNSDTDTTPMGFVIDEDSMVSDSDTKVPTQQSVKAYVDGIVASGVTYKGGYNAATDTPKLDSPVIIATAIGDMYTVTADGLFFTEQVRIGDVLLCEAVNAITLAEWSIIERNLDLASETVAGIAELATQVETDAGSDDARIVTPLKLNTWPGSTNLVTVGTITTGTWNGTAIGATYLPDASETAKGIIEIATQAEVDAGASALLAVTPSYLHNTTFDGGTF